MRLFKDIIAQMQNKGDNRFSLYELLNIFIEECSWVGTNQQFMELASIWHEISGTRVNTGCPACCLDTLKGLKNWYLRESEIHSKEVQPKKNKKHGTNSTLL